MNGVVPETGTASFDARLDRIESRLRLNDDSSTEDARGQNINKSLAEVAFLWAAIPEDESSSSNPEVAVEAAREIARRLEDGGKPAIAQAIQELRARSKVVKQIARSLAMLLQAKGTILTRSVDGQRWDYYINVLPTLIDAGRMSGRVGDPLAVVGQGSQEQIEFLRHISISRDRSEPGAVLSVRAQVRLMERSLATTGEPAEIETQRAVPGNLIQVVWRSKNAQAEPDLAETGWLVSPRIEVAYDLRAIKRLDSMKEPPHLNVLAATRAALAILAHTTLLRLAQRAEAATGRRASLSILRLQATGRGADPLSGDESVYAAAQAVEVALSRDADLRMQGISVGSSSPNDLYKRRGTYAALFSGFPLRIAQPHGDRPMVGVVTYTARPCNEHPDCPNAAGRSLVIARTYLATPIDSPYAGYEVRTTGSRTELCDPNESLPEVVAAEIDRLHSHGCRDVILVSHRFGQRRVGSGTAHQRLRNQGDLLNRLAESHPDMRVYPLVCDVFPATRLRSRQHEDAFEILRVSDHVDGANSQVVPHELNRPRHRYEPVYSLATLHVVGGKDALISKPQSGICTYFLLRDSGVAATEVRVRIESNLLGDTSAVRPSLVAVLRSLHYLESERSTGKYVQPTLDPYDWMSPDSIGQVGEILAQPSTRRGRGTVRLSLLALLDWTSRVLHALPPVPENGQSPVTRHQNGVAHAGQMGPLP